MFFAWFTFYFYLVHCRHFFVFVIIIGILIIFNIFQSPQNSFFFVIFIIQSLTKNFAQWRIIKFFCSSTLGLYPKSSPVKYSYLLNLPEDNADILAVNLSKSYFAWFALILLSIINNLTSYCHFYKESNKFFLNLQGSLASNVVSVVKKLKDSFLHSLQVFLKSW